MTFLTSIFALTLWFISAQAMEEQKEKQEFYELLEPGETIDEVPGAPIDWVKEGKDWFRDRVNITPKVMGLPVVSPNIKVAVIDTGFDKTHPLLEKCLTKGNNARDMNKDIDCSIDFKRKEDTSHGTHVAGIIAQVAPSAKIVPIKIGSKFYNLTYIDIIVRALREIAKDDDIKIVSISLGVNEAVQKSRQVFLALRKVAKKGKLVVFSAGNDREIYGHDASTSRIVELMQDPKVKNRIIAVSASKDKGGVEVIWRHSARAGNYPEYFVTAPGKYVYSSVPRPYEEEMYDFLSGTSMAAPIVSGILAHIMAVTGCDIDKAREYLFKGVITERDGEELDPSYYGIGIVDMEKIVLNAYANEKENIKAKMESNKKERSKHFFQDKEGAKLIDQYRRKIKVDD